MLKKQTFIERAAEAWDVTPAEALDLLSLPIQKSLRINPIKAKKSLLKDLKKRGIELEPIHWCEHAYWVTKGYEKVSSDPAFTAGELILQDQASFIPSLAIDPQAKELILDMCAAPGAKTTHLGALSANKAHIIANDSSKARFFKLRDILQQYSVEAETKLHDGRHLHKSFPDQKFDKILLDAPCSGEANIRPDNPKSYASWSMSKIKRLSKLQKQLITSAYDKLVVGGTLVYSTCTVAPEENELVVAYLLKRRPGAVLEPIVHKPADARKGLTHWQGKDVPQQLEQACRLVPSPTHESFFVAKIVKSSASSEGEDYFDTKA